MAPSNFSIITVFVSGVFALLVALVTSFLTNRKEKRRYKQELEEKRYGAKQDRYVRIIASINKNVRSIKLGEDATDVAGEFSLLSAETTLMENAEFNQKFSDVDDAMRAWAVQHYQASPKKIGIMGLAMISSLDEDHKPEAKRLYAAFNKEMFEFIQLMKANLDR